MTLPEALRAGEPVTLSLAEVGARGLLESLANDSGSYHVRIESLVAQIEIEIGSGIVMGARALREGKELLGRDAYVLLRRIEKGTARVEPRRFLSLANVLEPIAALPRLDKLSSIPPRHLPSVEVDLPPELADGSLPRTRQIALPPPRRRARPAEVRSERRVQPWLVAATVVIALSGLATGALAGWHSSDEPRPVSLPIAVAPETVAVPAADTALADTEEAPPEEEDVVPAREDPRRLARSARRALHRGNVRAALRRARRAARLRRRMPYYQVLLGDALAANGEDGAARRAWQRALRLQPGYAPAERRLQSHQS